MKRNNVSEVYIFEEFDIPLKYLTLFYKKKSKFV